MKNHPQISTIKINHPVRAVMPSFINHECITADGEHFGSHTILVRLVRDFSLDWLRGKSRGKTYISWEVKTSKNHGFL